MNEDYSLFEGPSQDDFQFAEDSFKQDKEFIVLNSKISYMDKNQLITNLKQFNLNVHGGITTLKKRLKNHYRFQKLSSKSLKYIAKTFPYYVVIDFEATCNEINPPNFLHEIIEFPAVLVDSQKLAVVDEFQCYCKPRLNPSLTKFCTDLTGISQATVDEAEDFLVVLKKFESWMAEHKLGTKNKYAFVTDGPWDMRRFLQLQCKISQIQYPQYAKKWVNLRKTFSVFYRTKKMKLPNMLELLGSKFEGRQHSGLDDAKNIAALLLLMIKDSIPLEINECIKPVKPYYNFRNTFYEVKAKNSDVIKDEEKEEKESENKEKEKVSGEL